MFSIGKKNDKFAIYKNNKVALTTTKELTLDARQAGLIKAILDSSTEYEPIFDGKTQKEIDRLIVWLIPIHRQPVS